MSIKKMVEQSDKKTEIVFMQNHGVIVSADDAAKSLQIHTDLNQAIQDYLKIDAKSFTSWNYIKEMQYVKEHILFPDQVVYTCAGEEILQTEAAQQTLLAYSFILGKVEEKGLTPHFIDRNNAEILLNMESEKYRQKILKKK